MKTNIKPESSHLSSAAHTNPSPVAMMQLALCWITALLTSVASAPIDKFPTALNDISFLCDSTQGNCPITSDNFLTSSADLTSAPPSKNNLGVYISPETPKCNSVPGGCLSMSDISTLTSDTTSNNLLVEEKLREPKTLTQQKAFLTHPDTDFQCGEPTEVQGVVYCAVCGSLYECLGYTVEAYGDDNDIVVFCANQRSNFCTELTGPLSHYPSPGNSHGQAWCKDCPKVERPLQSICLFALCLPL